MPVRKRKDRRTNRVNFTVTPELLAAHRAYINSPPKGGGDWTEHWALHDLLDDAGVLETPLIPPCCWHPGLVGVDWRVVPQAVPIHRRLEEF